MLKYLFALGLLLSAAHLQSQTIIENEDFSSGLGSWSAVSISDATDVWTASGGVVDMNGFGGSDDEDWLISPAINMDAQGAEYFMFDYNDGFDGNLLELYYSSNYTNAGTAASVTSATWTQIPLELIDINSVSCFTTLYQTHPAIDISALTGASVYFAFKYTGTSSTSKDYSLDNIRIEADYYSDVQTYLNNGGDCAPFKTELHNLIKQQRRAVPYTSSQFDVWDSYLQIDSRLNDAGTEIIVWDMFTDYPTSTGEPEFDHCTNRDQGSCPGTIGSCYNREHTLPRSWWGGGTGNLDTQNVDLHHLYPSDRELNAAKSNWPPGIVTNATTSFGNGYKVGTNPTYPCSSMEYFEPIDEYKGDYARTFFYLSTRYESKIGGWETINTRGDCALDGSAYTAYEPWLLSLLLQWHAADPVSQKEIDRNNGVYAIQGNRNPFIDNPTWVDGIWGTAAGLDCSVIALPLEYASFQVELIDSDVEIRWTTSSEINTDYFQIEKSHEGIEWSALERVQAAGNSQVEIQYSTQDNQVQFGTTYYRIKSVDLDGTVQYSDIQSVTRQRDDLTSLSVFPNPSTGVFRIDNSSLPPDREWTYVVYNTQGQIIKQQNIQNTSEFFIREAGVYMIQVIDTSGEYQLTSKIFVTQ